MILASYLILGDGIDEIFEFILEEYENGMISAHPYDDESFSILCPQKEVSTFFNLVSKYLKARYLNQGIRVRVLYKGMYIVDGNQYA